MAAKNYIGLSSSIHDSSIAIVNSLGELVFAEATERLLQNKRSWGYVPDDNLRTADLIEKYLNYNFETVIAQSWEKPHPLKFWLYINVFLPIKRKDVGPKTYEFVYRFLNMNYGNHVYTSGKQARNILRNINPKMNVIERHYNHHLSHAAAGCYTSPFKDAVCVVIDGFGDDFVTTDFYHYRNGKISSIKGISGSRFASLGGFYSQMCLACGFDPQAGEEWKVMGLSGYGKLNSILFESLKECMFIKNGMIVQTSKYNKLMAELIAEGEKHKSNPIQAADIAFTTQHFYKRLVDEMIENLYSLGISENLVLSGGCGLNSAYNGTITEDSKFKRVHIYCAPADDGNSVGAAYCAFYEDNPHLPAPETLATPYLGSSISIKSLDRLKKFSGLKQKTLSDTELSVYIAEKLSEKKIVAWCRGRAEFGPRALGNRSILADPRDKEVKEKLNSIVKFREEFRPFAPACLHEFGHEYFECYQETPYMERALRFKDEVKEKVPGVVHVDGTGRLQSVKKEWNEPYYNLISQFHKITGIPIILNTSLNVMGKPIVHSVEDAIAVFCTSGIDILVIENTIFEK